MPRSLFTWPPGHSFTLTHSGFGPSKKEPSSSTQGTGTNAIPITPSIPTSGHVIPDAAANAMEKAERRQRRKERKEEKAARSAKKAAREEQKRRVRNDRSQHDNYLPRSLSPVRRGRDSRSPSPKRHCSHDIANHDDHEDDKYRRRSRKYHGSDHDRFHNHRSSRSRSPPRRDSQRDSELPPPRPTRDRQWSNYNTTRQTLAGDGSWGRK